MSVVVTSDKLKSVRASINAALNRSLPQKVEVVQYPDGRPLKQFAKGDRVTFALIAVAALPEFAERNRGVRVPVVPLHKLTRFDSPNAWLGWYERWAKNDADAYALTNASATFFWGLSNRPEKQQVLRAEWDSDDTANAESGQPHWQFDPTFRWVPEQATELSASAGPSELTELKEEGEDEVLVEYTEPVAQDLSLAKMHLSMAGWRNGNKRSTWWKQPFPQQPALFAEWAERVISHASDQFRLFSVKAIA